MTLKQIFQLENIPCLRLQNILIRLLAKVCFDALFLCLSRFVAFRVTFNDFCFWMPRCGLLSCIHLRVTDQRWQTNPIESVLHFKIVFAVCWHQNGKLLHVVYFLVSFILFKLHKLSSSVRILKILNQIFQLESILYVYLHDIWSDCWQKFVMMHHLCVCLDLVHFVVFLTSYAVERYVVDYCHAYSYR